MSTESHTNRNCGLGCVGAFVLFCGFGIWHQATEPKPPNPLEVERQAEQDINETKKGYALGNEVGKFWREQGKPEPTREGVNQLITETTPSVSRYYRLGFYSGAVNGWRGIEPPESMRMELRWSGR